jgi:hypothetical protein
MSRKRSWWNRRSGSDEGARLAASCGDGTSSGGDRHRPKGATAGSKVSFRPWAFGEARVPVRWGRFLGTSDRLTVVERDGSPAGDAVAP